MLSLFDITGDPLCLTNIAECLEASSLAYSRFTYAEDREEVLVQDSDNCFVIAFPGTHVIGDVLRDVEAVLTKRTILGIECRVHFGFDYSWDKIKDNVLAAAAKMNKPIFVTGHSKGGAVAKRCALALLGVANVQVQGVITFGEPRGGDGAYARLYESRLGQRTIRVTNGADCVPWMPPCLPQWIPGIEIGNYRHAGSEGFMPAKADTLNISPSLLSKLWSDGWEIFKGWQTKELSALDDHHISNYRERFRRVQQ